MAGTLSVKNGAGERTGIGALKNKVSKLQSQVVKIEDDCKGKATEAQKETATQFLKLLSDFKIFLTISQNTIQKIEHELHTVDSKQQSKLGEK